MDCSARCEYGLEDGDPCGSKLHTTDKHNSVCGRCEGYLEKQLSDFRQVPAYESLIAEPPKFFQGHSRSSNKSCRFYKDPLTEIRPGFRQATTVMSLKQFLRIDAVLDGQPAIEVVQNEIDDAVLRVTTVAKQTLPFLNHFYRHILTNLKDNVSSAGSGPVELGGSFMSKDLILNIMNELFTNTDQSLKRKRKRNMEDDGEEEGVKVVKKGKVVDRDNRELGSPQRVVTASIENDGKPFTF